MRRRTLALIALYGAIAVLLLVPFVDSRLLDPSISFPLWALSALYCVTDLTAVRLRAGPAEWTVSLREIPRVLGLFFVTPLTLVLSHVVGMGAAQAVRRRGTVLENVLELAQAAASTAAALAVFRVVVSDSHPFSAIGWFAAMLATVASTAVTESVPFEHARSSGPTQGGRWWGLVLGAASALVVTALALIGVYHLHLDWNDIWLLTVPTVLLWIAVRAYAELQERQGILERLFDQDVFAMGLTDARLRLTRVNDVVCRVTGYEREELIGRSLAEMIHPEDRAEMLRRIAEVVAGEAPSYSVEVRGVAKDDRVFWANFATWPVRDERGRIGGCLGVFEDITEARRARDRARRTEERVRQGVLAMTDAREPQLVLQAVVDLAREILEARYAALGVLPEEGGGLSDFLVSGIDDETIAAIGDMPTGKGLLGAVTSATEPIRLADLTRHPESRGFPEHHPPMRSFLGVPIAYKGRVLGNLYLADKVGAPEFTDEDTALVLAFAAQAAVVIENARMHETERELIDQLDRMNTELQRASETRSVFLASMSHELRTPLHAMLMAADILSDPTFSVSTARARELSGTIATSGRHLLGLIDDLLELSRIEAGRFHVRLEPTSLNLLLTECRQAAGPLAAGKKVRLDIPTVEGIWVEADPLRVRQALLNLLANAVKFTDRGGRVWVEVLPSDGSVTIAICDTGRGIAPEDLGRIFDPFQQGSAATHGVGLGLAISSSIARAHGGRLEVTSEPGVGSRFGLSLRRSRRTVARATARAPGSLPLAGTAVLVVEDDPRALELTLEVLSRGGYTATGARSVAEALASVRMSRPDLVLLDVKLGTEDGLDIARRLREDPETRDVAVVASSASTTDADVERAREAGCVAFLAKPLTTHSLLSTLRASLEGTPGR